MARGEAGETPSSRAGPGYWAHRVLVESDKVGSHFDPDAVVAMPQELSQITLRGRRNPDSWKAVLEQKIENMPRISRIGFLLAYHRRADRGGIADPKLVPQLGEGPLEPLRTRLPPYQLAPASIGWRKTPRPHRSCARGGAR